MNENQVELNNADDIRKYFYRDKLDRGYFESLQECINEKKNNKTTYFFPDAEDTFIKTDDFFYVARRFNSYTPALPLEMEKYGKGKVKKYTGRKGGGYLLSWKGKLIAIDPGYNFIENIYYNENVRITDIDCIIITHAHPDHASDFENMLILLYEYNDALNELENKGSFKNHYIDVFLNLTAAQRFLNIIQINEYVKNIKILNPCDSYVLKDYDIQLKLINNKHEDLISDQFTIGLFLNLCEDKKIKFKLGLTSDTGWRVGGDLSKFYKEAQLLVVHVGGIKLREIQLNMYDYKLADIYYQNHLGFLGTYNLISDVNSENIILSEFGEELVCTGPLNRVDSRIRLAEILSDILYKSKSIKKKIIPGDIGLKIFIPDLTTQCSNCGKQINFGEIIPTTIKEPKDKVYHGIVYYCNSCYEEKTNCKIELTINNQPTEY